MQIFEKKNFYIQILSYRQTNFKFFFRKQNMAQNLPQKM